LGNETSQSDELSPSQPPKRKSWWQRALHFTHSPHFECLANYESPTGKKTCTHTNVEITFLNFSRNSQKLMKVYYKIEVVDYSRQLL